jgi:hypothetical protein
MPNRYLCDVFEEMRKCNETRNFSYMPGLIEEAQVLANRMEASLHDKAALRHLRTNIRELKDERLELRHEIEEMKSDKIRIKLSAA